MSSTTINDLPLLQFRKQIRRLCQKSTCCCCICLERDSEDKTRDLYTGATLMEAASSSSSSGQQQHPQPGGNNTTGSSSVSSSSNSSTLPSRMITESSSGSNGGRVGILHYNNPSGLHGCYNGGGGTVSHPHYHGQFHGSQNPLNTLSLCLAHHHSPPQ
ncbi:Uncharacterized protein FKW44_022604, partial [Caligus rogercresseyi]